MLHTTRQRLSFGSAVKVHLWWVIDRQKSLCDDTLHCRYRLPSPIITRSQLLGDSLSVQFMSAAVPYDLRNHLRQRELANFTIALIPVITLYYQLPTTTICNFCHQYLNCLFCFFLIKFLPCNCFHVYIHTVLSDSLYLFQSPVLRFLTVFEHCCNHLKMTYDQCKTEK